MTDILSRYLNDKRTLDAFSCLDRGHLNKREDAAKAFVSIRNICHDQLPGFVLEANCLTVPELSQLYSENQQVYFENDTCLKEISRLIENPGDEAKKIYEKFLATR